MPGADIFYICNICSYVVDSLQALNHLIEHLHESYCNLCERHISDLVGHVDTHLTKLYRCPTCKEVYSSTRDYRAHRDSHRLNCFHCGQAFTDEETLKLHVKNEHSPTEPHEGEGEGEEKMEVQEECTEEQDPSYYIDNDLCDVQEDDASNDGYGEEDSGNTHEPQSQPNDAQVNTEDLPEPVTKKKRGRPKGSKNKIKVEPDHSPASGRRVKTRKSVKEEVGSEENISPAKTRSRRVKTRKIVEEEVSSEEDRSPSKTRRTSVKTRKIAEEDVNYSGEDIVDSSEEPEWSTGRKTRAKTQRKGQRGKGKVKSNVHKCETCGEIFNTWKKLRHHMNTVGCHKCPLCAALFKQATNLMLHIRVHTGEKPHLCSLCGKRFRTTGGLDDHMRRHNNIKPHKCRHCPKAFVQVSHRKRHEDLVHNGVKNHQCTVCGKTFSLAFHARRHALIHSGEKKFECATCGKQILDVSNFRKHLDVHKKHGDLTLPISEQAMGRQTQVTITESQPVDGSQLEVEEVVSVTEADKQLYPLLELNQQLLDSVDENTITTVANVNDNTVTTMTVTGVMKDNLTQTIQTTASNTHQSYPLLRMNLQPNPAEQRTDKQDGHVEMIKVTAPTVANTPSVNTTGAVTNKQTYPLLRLNLQGHPIQQLYLPEQLEKNSENNKNTVINSQVLQDGGGEGSKQLHPLVSVTLQDDAGLGQEIVTSTDSQVVVTQAEPVNTNDINQIVVTQAEPVNTNDMNQVVVTEAEIVNSNDINQIVVVTEAEMVNSNSMDQVVVTEAEMVHSNNMNQVVVTEAEMVHSNNMNQVVVTEAEMVHSNSMGQVVVTEEMVHSNNMNQVVVTEAEMVNSNDINQIVVVTEAESVNSNSMNQIVVTQGEPVYRHDINQIVVRQGDPVNRHDINRIVVRQGEPGNRHDINRIVVRQGEPINRHDINRIVVRQGEPVNRHDINRIVVRQGEPGNRHDINRIVVRQGEPINRHDINQIVVRQGEPVIPDVINQVVVVTEAEPVNSNAINQVVVSQAETVNSNVIKVADLVTENDNPGIRVHGVELKEIVFTQ